MITGIFCRSTTNRTRGPRFESPIQGALVALVLAAALQLWIAAPAYGQKRVNVPNDVTCPDCEIKLTHLFTLGAVDGEKAISSPPAAMTKDSRGHYLYVPEMSREKIYAFDKHRRRLGQIGREGAGPGEFRSVSEILVTPGDSLYVFDAGNGRISVLTPDWNPVRTIPFPHRAHDAIRLADGRLVVRAHIRSPERVGLPLQLIGVDGRVERSFGAEDPVYRIDAPGLVSRSIAPNGPDRIWTAHGTQYVIESWTVEGTLERILVRDAPWFRPYVRADPVTPDNPPAPSTWTIKVGEHGNLWTTIIVADPNYAHALSRNPSVAEGQRVYEIVGDLDDLLDGIIEVIDARPAG